MTSPFAAAAKVAANAHDRVMGEAFEYRPFAAADVNAAPAADAQRAVVSDLLAVFGEPSARGDSGPVHLIGVTAGHPGHATLRPFISFALDRLPYAPRKGDRVRRVATNAVYQVAEVLPSTPGFVRLDLNRI